MRNLIRSLLLTVSVILLVVSVSYPMSGCFGNCDCCQRPEGGESSEHQCCPEPTKPQSSDLDGSPQRCHMNGREVPLTEPRQFESRNPSQETSWFAPPALVSHHFKIFEFWPSVPVRESQPEIRSSYDRPGRSPLRI